MKKEKILGELAKEFPDKRYRELEIYRDADRQEEAQKIPLTESQQKQEELEPIAKGACITAEMRKDREEPDWFPDGITFQEKYKKEHKLRQEAEGELTILKGIETNRVKEAQARCNQLQDELDRVKKENNDLFKRIANALEVDESHQKLNGKLQERLTELEEENKRMHDESNKKLDSARKAGM